jgi:adenylyltransferase/sulfurtransferase
MVPEISPRELAVRIENGHRVRLLDVRQAWENEIAALPDSIHIPLNELPRRAGEIDRDKGAVIVYCHYGVRSLSAANFLVRLGFDDVQSLAGGIDAWSREVDPKVPRY